ncbi:hypothetical protein AB1Y20_020722 [Prymnesium parvum]|uniref:Uncharacterized protein n=1 Tax=Prymnesium parvum TaxID=97485 RepID=A0AB34K086_PRYPA
MDHAPLPTHPPLQPQLEEASVRLPLLTTPRPLLLNAHLDVEQQRERGAAPMPSSAKLALSSEALVSVHGSWASCFCVRGLVGSKV